MNIGNITVAPVSSVAEIIDLSESLLNGKGSKTAQRWAFRGQPMEFQTLSPSFRRVFGNPSYGTAEIIEGELIKAFRNHYAVLPDRSKDMPEPANIADGYDLRCLSVMQHYEVPTRLLDWTSDFWTAVYFACASDPGQNAELWYYDRQIFDAQAEASIPLSSLNSSEMPPPREPPFLNKRDEKNLIVELDPKLTPRMKQQFAHHTVSADVFADHAPLLYELQQTLPATEDQPFRFRRVPIANTCKDKALRFLADHKGITASTIFPDVVGLGRFLRWQLESLRTMLL